MCLLTAPKIIWADWPYFGHEIWVPHVIYLRRISHYCGQLIYTYHRFCRYVVAVPDVAVDIWQILVETHDVCQVLVQFRGELLMSENEMMNHGSIRVYEAYKQYFSPFTITFLSDQYRNVWLYYCQRLAEYSSLFNFFFKLTLKILV